MRRKKMEDAESVIEIQSESQPKPQPQSADEAADEISEMQETGKVGDLIPRRKAETQEPKEKRKREGGGNKTPSERTRSSS